MLTRRVSESPLTRYEVAQDPLPDKPAGAWSERRL